MIVETGLKEENDARVLECSSPNVDLTLSELKMGGEDKIT